MKFTKHTLLDRDRAWLLRQGKQFECFVVKYKRQCTRQFVCEKIDGILSINFSADLTFWFPAIYFITFKQ